MSFIIPNSSATATTSTITAPTTTPMPTLTSGAMQAMAMSESNATAKIVLPGTVHSMESSHQSSSMSASLSTTTTTTAASFSSRKVEGSISDKSLLTAAASATALSGKDVAKNIEIRRMSSTEAGDKVLDSAWDSPEKEEKGRTPLEMVQNIVSNIEKIDKDATTTPTMTSASSAGSKKSKRQLQHPAASPDPPASTQTPSKPLPPNQTLRPDYNPPSSTVPSLLTRTGPPNVTVLNPGLHQSASLMATGQGVVQMPTPQAPQVMQLVNTINGPMLVPEGQHLQQFQASLQSPTKSNQEPPKLMIPTMQGPHPILMSPGHQLIAIAPQQQQQQQQQQTSTGSSDRGSTSQTSPQGQQVFLNQVNKFVTFHSIELTRLLLETVHFYRYF